MTTSDTPRERFAEKLRLLPALPGVYMFLDGRRDVIYVGKAKRLDSRVRSYFTGDHAHPKTRAMVHAARDLDTIVTDSEMEALLLEITLIQQHKPLYNINLKDDKSYPYVRVSVQEEIPRLAIIRRPADDGARYFGPFTEVKVLRQTMRTVRRLFPIRTCVTLPAKACFNYHIGRCVAPCDGHATIAEHRRIVDDLVAFLSGKGENVLERLRAQMDRLAEERHYEDAARLRDQIRGMEHLLARQKVAVLGDYEADAVGLARENDLAVLTFLSVRDGQVVASHDVPLTGVADRDEAEILDAALAQHYARAVAIPREILVSTVPTTAALLESWLAQRARRRVSVRVPQRGRGRGLLRLAARNALHALERRRTEGTAAWIGDESAQDLARELALSAIPRRIEGYDVSNIGGRFGCVSLVSFYRGAPRRSEYRTFRIRTVDGQDDFAMLREALTRRFTGSLVTSLPDPDLIMIDGGAGQVSAAATALRDAGRDGVPLVGLAKKQEEIYPWSWSAHGVGSPRRLSRRSEGLKLLQRVRDEAHRVAVTYNRKLRRPTIRRSRLEDVPGLGPKRARLLLTTFGSLDALRHASPDDLQRVPGIGPSLAAQVTTWLAHDAAQRSA